MTAPVLASNLPVGRKKPLSEPDNDPAAESTWLRDAASTPTAPEEDATTQVRLPAPGALVAGKYRIEALIGRGGMGAVYRARHELMEKPVALKWLVPDLHGREEARARFLQEARVAARLNHPNVVNVYDVGEQNGALFMVMELLEGESFEALVERGEIPIPDMLQLLVQAMWGVAAAHAHGIVHRDIKPDNIFVTPDPTHPLGHRAKVLDFGISKLSDEQQPQAGITKSGVTMGTPAYMSMEQMQGAKEVDARADVYSFGVLMYRALTGRLPFAGETFGAVAVAIATETPPPPKTLRSDLPQALNDVVLKAMARRREDRFEDLQQLLTQLHALSTATGYLGQMTHPSTLPPSITPQSGERVAPQVPALGSEGERRAVDNGRARRGSVRVLLMLAAVLAAAALAYFLLSPAPEQPAAGAGAAEVHVREPALKGPAPAPSADRVPPAVDLGAEPAQPAPGTAPAQPKPTQSTSANEPVPADSSAEAPHAPTKVKTSPRAKATRKAARGTKARDRTATRRGAPGTTNPASEPAPTQQATAAQGPKPRAQTEASPAAKGAVEGGHSPSAPPPPSPDSPPPREHRSGGLKHGEF